MDRKTQTILSEISDIRKDINAIKSEQIIGQDNPRLRLFSNDNSFDIQQTIPAGNLLNVFSQFIYNAPTDLRPWQPTAYVQIFFQLWVDNLSSPWEGYTGAINIVAFEEELANTVTESVRVAIRNNDAVSHTIYIKFWAISTAINGEFSVFAI